MIRWHLKHRKQEIIGALFALAAVAFVAVRVAMADDRTDCEYTKAQCSAYKTQCVNQYYDLSAHNNQTYSDIEDVQARFNQVYNNMSQADRDSVTDSLTFANAQSSYGHSDWTTGKYFESNTAGNPVGGDVFRTQGDSYYGMGQWVAAMGKYNCAINQYLSAKGSYNTAEGHYNSADAFVDDAWDVLQNYP